MITNIPLPKDLYEITCSYKEILNETVNATNMETVFYVDKKNLKQINEELYFINHSEGTPEETDEIIININNYKFIYKIKNETDD